MSGVDAGTLADQMASARELLAEVRGATKDLRQVIREAREVRATLVVEMVEAEVRHVITEEVEKVRAQVVGVSERIANRIVSTAKATEERQDALIGELDRIEEMLKPMKNVSEEELHAAALKAALFGHPRRIKSET